MTRKRRDIWKLAGTWDEPVLWYARAVKVLQARKNIADVTSWRYLAAMHGISESLWRNFGYLQPNEKLPSTSSFAQDRDQCQHHNWYFPPWHRGYLAAFEKILMAAIAAMNGPKDWALPYWNYSDKNNPNALTFPPAFATQNWPDGNDNPLFVQRRYGVGGDGQIVLRDRDVDLRAALREDEFTGVMTGGSPGFGGAETPFQHNADRKAEGLLEQTPHDIIHGRIGGMRNNDFSSQLNLGLMSSPSIAALDPIFWLHHSNIDRLWEVWLRRPTNHKNPAKAAWLDGPQGAQIFIMPAPDGSRHQFTARDMLDTTAPALNYEYEDVSDPLAGEQRVAARLRTLELATAPQRELAMAKAPQVELLGANEKPMKLSGQGAATSVRIDQPTGRKVLENFQPHALAEAARREPDRIFLNLENITGSNDAAVFDVYVGLSPNEAPKDHPENFVGVVSLFGLHEATTMAEPHGGSGLNKVIEITDVVDRMHLDNALDLNELPVTFVAPQGLGDDIQIGRVSIYRQGE